MAEPTAYTISYSFSDHEASFPDTGRPGNRLDIEFAGIAAALLSTQDALADVRRSDGALKNGIVTPDAVALNAGHSLSAGSTIISDGLGGWGAVALNADGAVDVAGYAAAAEAAQTAAEAAQAAVEAAARYRHVSVVTISGAANPYTLDMEVVDEADVQVFVDGALVSPALYSVAGDQLTFGSGWPSGTTAVVVVWGRATLVGEGDETAAFFATPAALVAGSWAGGAAGDYVQAGRYSYKVAASGASDHDLTNAAGTKFYVEPIAGRINPLAFGAEAGNASYDCGPDLEAALRAAARVGGFVGWEGDLHIDSEVDLSDLTVPVVIWNADENASRVIVKTTSGKAIVQYDATDPNLGTTSALSAPPMSIVQTGFVFSGSSDAVGPMIERARGPSLVFHGNLLDGGCADDDTGATPRVRYGAWFGRGYTVWASSIVGNRVRGGDIGIVVGDLLDATNMTITGNILERSWVCAMIVCQPRGGLIAANGAEWNYGKTALAILSKTGHQATTFTLRDNYGYNNCRDSVNNSGEMDEYIPLRVGVSVPDTDFTTPSTLEFTSTTTAAAFAVEGGYWVGDDQYQAMALNVTRGASVKRCLVLRKTTGATTTAYDGVVTGDTNSFVSEAVYNQNTGDANNWENSTGTPFRKYQLTDENGDVTVGNDLAVANDVVVNGVTELRDDTEVQGDLGVAGDMKFASADATKDGRAGVGTINTSGTGTGSGGTWTDVLSFDKYKCVGCFVLTHEQSDQSQQTRFVFYASDLNSGSTITPAYVESTAGAGAPADNAQFRVESDVLQFKADNNWKLVGSYQWAGSNDSVQ